MRKEFYKDIFTLARKAVNDKNELMAKVKEIEKQINSSDYSVSYKKGLEEQKTTLKIQIEDFEFSTLREVEKRINDFIAEVGKETELNGADVTEDIKLLDFDLSAPELVRLIEKHQSNPTMVQLILKNAKSRGINLGIHFVGNQAIVDLAKQVKNAVRVALNHSYNERMFEQFFGEGSVLEQNFNVDDPKRGVNDSVIGYSDDRVRNAVALLEGKTELSEYTQRDIIKEFSGSPGVVSVLMSAARRGGRTYAEDEAAKVFGMSE